LLYAKRGYRVFYKDLYFITFCDVILKTEKYLIENTNKEAT
jgi:hypothetical protein